MLKTILYIALGGALGSVMRYLTSVLVNRFWAESFPLATFITNMAGCFLIGIFTGWLTKSQLQGTATQWFLITGFCGGFTTYSTFGMENINLLQSQQTGTAFAYIALSIAGGLLGVWGGLTVIK